VSTEHATPPRHDGSVVSLAGILNILWRRRLIIVAFTLFGLIAGLVYIKITKPLYRSVATVRPGITSFDDKGAPRRTWQIKDIVRWYRSGLYGKGLKQRMGLPEDAYRPDIMAEFIPRGVGIQGGDVITLTTLSTSQDQAVEILAASIETFNEYAEINSVGNSLSLARTNLQNEIENLGNDRENITIKKDLLDLPIARKRQELMGIDIDQQRLDLAVQEHLAKQRLRDDKADILNAGVDSTLTGLAQMSQLLERMREKDSRQGEIDSTLAAIPETERLPFLWWELAQDKTAMAGRMLISSLEVMNNLYDDQLQAANLQHLGEIESYQHEADFLQRSYDLAYRKAFLESEIEEMEINRDRTLPQEQIDIEDEMRLLQSRVEVLTPMESIGTIAVSDGPVRPRKQRAVGLLTLMGLLGSLALVFCWEYVSLNHREIFANKRSGD